VDNEDYYHLLGVQKTASPEELKKAFRRKAHQYHPDKSQGNKANEEKFKKINSAYEVLKDPQKRARYDQFGAEGIGGAGFRDSGYAEAGFGDFQDIFGDVFADFFGGSQRGGAGRKGADLRYDLTISFEEAAFGTEKKFKIPKRVKCSECNGSRSKPGTYPKKCAQCNGAGQVSVQQGFFNIARTCPACGGEGSVIETPCTKCSGVGKEETLASISLKIPPGVDVGSRLRLSGEGDSGEMGGPKGDLYIVINIEEHPIFERQDDDVICEFPVSFSQVALGSEVQVPTLDGNVKLKIPAGTQSGKVFRLAGKGIASLHSGRRGDQLVIIKLETPAKLNKKQRELLEEFAKVSGEETFPMKSSFFGKVKDLFD
jgi:molecular chaperone DnaJ